MLINGVKSLRIEWVYVIIWFKLNMFFIYCIQNQYGLIIISGTH